MTTKEKVYLKDNIASIIFNSPDCRKYVASVISSAIGIYKAKKKSEFKTYLLNKYK